MDPAATTPFGSALWARLVLTCQDLRGHRLPWVAVAWGTGIGVYFSLPIEPSPPQLAALAALAFALGVLSFLLRSSIGFPLLLAAVAGGGTLAGAARTAVVAGPVLDFRYYGPIEGRVRHVDRASSGAVRITLDRVRLDGVAAAGTPRRVRLSLHEEGVAPRPGAYVMTTGHLTTPNGPVEPGGFDFQRHAWFLQLGAVGYTRVPLLTAAPSDTGPAWVISEARLHLSDTLRANLPGTRGEVAAALVTGDRSGLPDEVVESLRRSNLAHLLAISGLHMGLLVGFAFWAVRGGLALFPAVALSQPIRVWAAAVALPLAVGYLLVSGGSVATQRAFVMAVVMLGAIMLGRRALSLRSVALAALLVLAWRPEMLTGPGFQMSFAATAALVLAFRALSDRRDWLGRWMTGWRGALLSLVVSSLVAGIATAPIAALHFNRVGHYGLAANMLAVPVMGTFVMPFLLVGVLLMPLGLAGGPLWVAGEGIAWIVRVADAIAALPGAISHVQAPDASVLPLLGLGMAVFASTRGRGRLVAAAALIAAAGLWAGSGRPDLLISGDGRLVGAMTEGGRWLSREKGAGFAAESWLENDGDGTPQAIAATRATASTALPDLVVLRGKSGLEGALRGCREGLHWLVTPVAVEGETRGCRLFDADSLRTTGSVAFHLRDGELAFVTAVELQGLRPWTPAYRALGR